MPAIRQIAAILVFVSATWAAGTAPGGVRAAASKTAARQGPSDADVERDIRARFAKSKINADKFQVHVQGGIATIEGRTDVVQHKGVATRLAKSGGAIAVKNEIQISEAAREKAAANLEKGRRRAQVKRGDARSEVAGRR